MNPLFPVVILCGGLGTRVASVAGQLPKVLIPINGVPFLAHQLNLLASAEFTKVILCIGYRGQSIIDFVQDGSAFQLDVQYVSDENQLLGTGGAVQAAFSVLPDDFFVIYGDSYLCCPYSEIQNKYLQSHLLGLMTIFKNDNNWDKSNVAYNGKSIIAYSKKHTTAGMNYIDYGLNIFSKKAFIPFNNLVSFDLSNVQEYLARENKLASYEATERFYEIGSIAGIADLESKIQSVL